MKDWKSHFVFNRSERNGIFLLVLIIIFLQGVYFYLRFTPEPSVSPEHREEVARLQARIDSLKRIASITDTVRIRPFNPNFISDYKGYTLGMSVEQIDRLHAFRETDQWINSTKEFQEVTGVSDSLLEKLSPFFKFPEIRTSGSKFQEVSKMKDKLPIRDLNAATAEDLMRVNGVGEVLSKRIIKYRESIGGFRDEQQLRDVYGLPPEVVGRITDNFRLLQPAEGEKQDLNNISVLDLSEIPGFTYELAREVIEYREEKKRFESLEELGKIKGFPVEKLERIQLYLTIE